MIRPLKTKLAELNISMNRLAKEIGMSYQNVWKIVNNESMPSYESALKVLHAVNKLSDKPVRLFDLFETGIEDCKHEDCSAGALACNNCGKTFD